MIMQPQNLSKNFPQKIVYYNKNSYKLNYNSKNYKKNTMIFISQTNPSSPYLKSKTKN